MAKSKSSKRDNVPQKHLHSRLSYLHQAATYLATVGNYNTQQGVAETAGTAASVDIKDSTSYNLTEATRLLMHLRAVSRKSQIRLAPRLKHSICKRCDALLIPGETMTEKVVNPSKGGRRPWADLFEIRCDKCGSIKRFPLRKKGDQVGVEGSKPIAKV
ncbi:uncharacterized protein Z519_02593 [Cladophialophora bantiana CBS 173.52]|uniref:Rpr2-domain-containing protein n=1 Tax=Cladophialophora bantiana (strain ATCC 10958 / CBS 173.52 / CDC B-1940 / NIH 8579) TaxID=1442370 RepID=A0A0D2F4P1_CLAB1|nr:uncharacterized protein Z519_02593 [Cladophialophora bantiana CBS 173.52]KIW97201.1 hypothetical protein Z519_02593 [Cladophialophora bantiana CBS 173.52]